VDDVALVQVAHAGKGLREELEGLCFGKAGFEVLVREEVAALRVLHHHEETVAVEQRFPETDDLRVVEFAVKAGLSLDQPRLSVRGHGCEVDLRGGRTTIFSA
jgi:hypothetical protein